MQTKTRTLVMCALMAAVLCVLSPIPIPIGPVPFTLGIFAVFLTGAMLPPMGALACVAVYVALGMVGLPVFSSFQAGPQVLVGPTGGYIVGYFIIVLFTSLAVRRTRRMGPQLAAGIAGLSLCYVLGTLWYMVAVGTTFAAGLAVCVVPFVLPDILKGVLALWLAKVLRRRIRSGG